MNNHTETMKAHIRDYLRGYGRNNLAALERLANFSRWPEMAEREILARASSLIGSFADDELSAVSFGQVDMQALAREVIAEMEAKP